MALRQTRTTTTTKRPGILTRLRGRATNTAYGPETTTVQTTTTTTQTKRVGGPRRSHFGRSRRGPVATDVAPIQHHRQKRRTTMGDKVSGAMTRLRGSLTGRPGVKAAGTRRMHGTDGRRSTRRRAVL